MLIVNLFQLGKQVGAGAQNRSFSPFTICAKHGLYPFQWHLRIKQCLSKQNTSSTTEMINKPGWNCLLWTIRKFLFSAFDVSLNWTVIAFSLLTMYELILPSAGISSLSNYSMLFICAYFISPLWFSIIVLTWPFPRALPPVSSQITPHTQLCIAQPVPRCNNLTWQGTHARPGQSC